MAKLVETVLNQVLQAQVNEEIRRRERVIRIFPNDASALRLIGALLAEQNEVWQERRYFDMSQFHEWKAEQDKKPSAARRLSHAA